MKNILPLLLLVLSAVLPGCSSSHGEMGASKQVVDTAADKRIISLSGLLTEVLYELGYGPQLVGVDVTSTYPASTDAIPKLGHISQLNAEAVLQLQPDVIFVEAAAAANQPVLDQLRQSGIAVLAVPTAYTLTNSVAAARVMAGALGSGSGKVVALQQKIMQDSTALQSTLAMYDIQPRVLFIYARGAGRLSVAGLNTSAAAIIAAAGGENAISTFEGFQVLTPEALVEAAPDVILMFSSGLASLDGATGLAQIPGMRETPAYRNDHIVAMDGHYLTAFGPRAAQAARELAIAIHSPAVQ